MNAQRPVSITQGTLAIKPARVDLRSFGALPAKLGDLLPHEADGSVEMNLLTLSTSAQSIGRFQGSSASDWSIASTFSDDSTLKRKEQTSILLESAQMSGIALSVGVVWWASRVTGVIGSLLASVPAWRHLDPLPVVGRDEAEEEGWEEQAAVEYADELAISMVLDGSSEGTSITS